MKNKKIKNFWLLVCLSLMSCSLDVIPPSEIAAENFWITEKDAWFGLNACYAKMPGFNITDELSTDNAHSHKPWEGPFELIQTDGISTKDAEWYDFGTVRVVNNFIEKVDACNINATLAMRLKAEARFIRAQQYLNLTNKFGKVAIVTHVLEYNAPPLPRNSVEEVRKFILDELKEIAETLPAKYNGGFLNETGRITRGAALALRARAALYFGNFKDAEADAKTVITEKNYSLFRVTTLNDAQKKEAAEMDQFVDFATKGIDKDQFMKGMFSYETLWHNSNAKPNNPEYILTREYTTDVNNRDGSRYIYIRPSQLVQGYSSYEPIQDLIDAYWDIDGKTIRTQITAPIRATHFMAMNQLVDGMDQKQYIAKVPTLDLSTYEFMKEYRNRDSRLYASILFPFKGWHETDFDKGTFYYRVDPKKIGIDGNEMWTGYSFRKIVALTPYNSAYSSDDYPVIRYAEVLLTYAEARIQNTGWDEEVRVQLNDLRDRCGMPDVPVSMGSKEAALDFVRNERRIELAGEGHRFDDIRRYGTAYCAKVMIGPTYAPAGPDGKPYLVVDKKWSDRLMLMPIPQNAMDLNPLLAKDQNNGY